MEQKENHRFKYRDAKSKQYLLEIRERYNQWNQDNTNLHGPVVEVSEQDPQIIAQRVELLNEYKDFIDQQHYAETFDSRSNLHSSVLEEFMYYLFRDLVLSISDTALIGKSHTFKDVFFRAHSYIDMLRNPNVMVEKKDHDFAIGVQVDATFICSGAEFLQ